MCVFKNIIHILTYIMHYISRLTVKYGRNFYLKNTRELSSIIMSSRVFLDSTIKIELSNKQRLFWTLIIKTYLLTTQ